MAKKKGMERTDAATKESPKIKDSQPVVGVVGSGSFATAIVKMLLENSRVVHWCVRSEFVKGALEQRGHNPTYLTSVTFNVKNLRITTDINEVVSACDVVVLATPSIYLADALGKMTCDYSGKTFVSAIKGIVPETGGLVAHYLEEVFGIALRDQAVIAGPCHAEEVAMERLSYLTIAAVDDDVSRALEKLFASDFIKVAVSRDVLGNEYSAILKNIYAIGAGIARGLNYGDNFTAVLVSNAIREMEVFLDTVHETPRDVNDSAYLGDLLVTAYSLFSRNRSLGNLVGKGYTVKSAIQSMNMIAEGYYAAEAIYKIASRHRVELPIITAVYEILYKEKKPEKCFSKLALKLD